MRTWAKSAQIRSSTPRSSGRNAQLVAVAVEESQGRLQFGLRRRPGVGVQVHPPDPAGRVEPLDRQHPPRPEPRLLGDERVVHQDQCLGRDVRHVAAPCRDQRRGHVEGGQHRRREVPPDGDVQAAPAVAVERAAGLGTTVVIAVVVHERGEVDLDSGPLPPAVEPPGDGQDRVPDRLGLQAADGHPVQQPVVGIGGLRLGRGRAGHPERAAEDQLAHQSFDRPAVPDEPIGEVVEQLRVGGSIAEGAEVVDGRDEPPAEEVVPDAVHRHARRQRVGRIGDPPGEFQPPAADGRGRRLPVARQGPDHPAGDDRPDILRVPAEGDRLVLGRPLRHGRRASGLGESGFDLPERLEERAEPNGGRRVEVQQSALDEPGEQAGPGLGIGQVGQRAVAHRRERFGHGPSVTPGEDGGRVDRIVPEQPERRSGRGHGRRSLIREEGAPEGDISLGTAAGRRAHVVQVLRRGVREFQVGAHGPATSPGRTSASGGRRRSGSAEVGRTAGPGSSRSAR